MSKIHSTLFFNQKHIDLQKKNKGGIIDKGGGKSGNNR